MPAKIDLPGDHWAIVKTAMEVTEREAREVNKQFVRMSRKAQGPKSVGAEAVGTTDPTEDTSRAILDQLDDDAKFDAYVDMEHYLVAWAVTSWDFDFDPSTESLNNLPRAVYNALDEATDELKGELIPALKKKDDEGPTTP